MDNLDFFSEYEGYKRRADKIFEALERKVNSNKSELDEAFFGLFGKNKDDESEENQEAQSSDSNADNQEDNHQQSYELTRTKNGVYYFGSTDRKTAVIDNAQSEIDTYNWETSPLRWLFESPLKFELNSIAFDFKKGIVLNVKSINWEGPFVGNTFNGVYSGNSFKGNFFGVNSNFKALPTAFVEGVFYDSTKTGLLGLDNITEVSVNDKFNLIQIPVGYSIEILTNKQIRHTISVDKRLDERDSNFAYTLYLGYEVDYSNPVKKVISWEQIRQEYNNYEISVDTTYIPNILTLQSGESIIEMKVLKSGTPPVFEKKERFDPSKKQEAVVYGYNLGFDINDEAEFEKFVKLKGYITSPQFIRDLKEVAQLIKSGVIDSEYISKNAPHLKNILADFIQHTSLQEVDLRGKKGSGGTRYNNFNKSGEFINTFTGRRIKTKADIQEFLHTKYRDYYSRYGEYPKEYEADYNFYYQNIIRRNKAHSSYDSSVGQQLSPVKKEGVDAIRRLQNLVVYFIDKIEAGEKTDSMRTFVANNLIKKNLQKYLPIQKKEVIPQGSEEPQQEPIGEPEKVTTKTKKTVSKPKKGGIAEGIKENQIRLVIKSILNDIL